MVSAASLFVLFSAFIGVLAAPTTLEEENADYILTDRNSLVKRQDYTQNYKTGGNVQFSTTTDGYSVTFSGAADFVVGRGWKTGTSRNITYTGTHKATAGTVTFQVYGWSKNPLVEYYIIEDYTSASQFGGGGGAGGGTKGTLTVDGSDYTIYETTRTNDPSIVGTSTFHQYISVRKDKRQSGTITTQAHFDAWAKAGMNLGTMDYQVLSTEGYNNAGGSTNQKLSAGAAAIAPAAPSST